MRIKYSLIILLLCFAYVLGCSSSKVKGKKKEWIWTLKSFKPQSDWKVADKKISFSFAPVSEKLPQSFFLSGVPKAGNQKGQASGTAWALGYFAASYLERRAKKNSKYRCSVAFIYNNLNNGVDRGIEIVEGLELLKKRGCPEEAFMPYNPKDPAHRATSRANKNASQHKIKNFARLDYSDLDQVRSHLVQNKAIIVSLVITENFINLSKEVWKKPDGAIRARHSVALIGYDDNKKLFYILNSFGNKWAKKGRCAIPYSWFIRLVKQAYVIW